MSSYDVRVWAIRHRPDRRQPYQVRWAVGGRPHAESFTTKALAESFRADLIKATRSGEPFDEATGRPESWARDVSWYVLAREYADLKWQRSAATARRPRAETLTDITLVMLAGRRGRPDEALLRELLHGWVFNVVQREQRTLNREQQDALAWIEKASRPVADLRDLTLVRTVLDRLSKLVDGKTPAAATTFARKRAVFFNVLGWAVERQLLAANPIAQVQWTPADRAEAIDRRVVASPEQVAMLLKAVRSENRTGDRLAGFFGCLYYAGMRPAEVIALREDDCVLPATGWGRLELVKSEPRAGTRWTDDGRARESRQLKRRAVAEVRRVPIPPVLVALLRDHLDRFGTAPDGRLFRSLRNEPVQASSYRGAWDRARKQALTKDQYRSPLARRPYDLRHAAASLWLNAGVPVTEVARRLGHSVPVLLKIYANCLDGQETTVNDQIDQALGTGSDHETLTTSSGPAGAGDGDGCGPVADQEAEQDPDS